MAGETQSWQQERRIVTAVVADIVGSVHLADGLDLEDAHEIIRGSVDAMIREIESLEGTVQEVSGHAVMALFGAPVAHEDDPVRGVLCGVRIVDALAAYGATLDDRRVPGGLAVRVGVDSGRVLAGRVEAGSRVEYGATGSVLSTADRLKDLALPNSVLVGQTTRGMVGDAFIWSDEADYLDPRSSTRLLAATALAFTPARRLEHRSSSLPLVGRLDERDILRSAVTELGVGHGSVIVIVGEPGAGKTRLVDELHALVPDLPPGRWLEATAASHSQSTPFRAYRSMSLRLTGLTESAQRAEYRDAMKKFAAGSSPEVASSILALLHTLGEIDGGERGQVGRGTTPESVRERIFEAILRLIASMSNEGPTVMVLEDLHWMDPTSVALTHLVADICLHLPLLTVITTRPDSSALDEVRVVGDRVGERMNRIDLRPLTRDEDRALLTARLQGFTLPLRLEEHVLQTAEGNPFFLLEQLRTVLESPALGTTPEDSRVTDDLILELAPTVERTLMARIDRLRHEDRQALLAASVLGQEFEGSMVDHLIGADATPSLVRLVEAEFLVDVEPAERTWTWFRFQHALVKQAAYSSLPRQDRRALHRAAADAIEVDFPEPTDAVAAALGRHLAEAGQSDRAIPYLLRAARSAAATFSNEEAAALAHDALALLGDVDDTNRPVVLELLRIVVAADRHGARYDRALSAQERLISLLPKSDIISRAAELRLASQILADDHQYKQALSALDMAEMSLGDEPLDAQGFDVWLKTNLTRGDIFYWLADDQALGELLERVRPVVDERATENQKYAYRMLMRSALLRRDRHVISDDALRIDKEIYLVGIASDDEEQRAWARFRHAFTLMWHRDLDESEGLFRQCLDDADRIGSAMLRARALTYLMVTARLGGDVETAAQYVEPVRESARRGSLIEYSAMASATAAWIAYRRGDSATVLSEGHQALALWATTPTRYTFDWMSCLPLLAVALDQGDLGRAEHWVRTVIAPDQQPLPAAVDALLRSGLKAAEQNREKAARDVLGAALREARNHQYL